MTATAMPAAARQTQLGQVGHLRQYCMPSLLTQQLNPPSFRTNAEVPTPVGPAGMKLLDLAETCTVKRKGAGAFDSTSGCAAQLCSPGGVDTQVQISPACQGLRACATLMAGPWTAPPARYTTCCHMTCRENLGILTGIPRPHVSSMHCPAHGCHGTTQHQSSQLSNCKPLHSQSTANNQTGQVDHSICRPHQWLRMFSLA